jgi:hypothetical protein
MEVPHGAMNRWMGVWIGAMNRRMEVPHGAMNRRMDKSNPYEDILFC